MAVSCTFHIRWLLAYINRTEIWTDHHWTICVIYSFCSVHGLIRGSKLFHINTRFIRKFVTPEFVITVNFWKELFRILPGAQKKLRNIREFAVSKFVQNKFYCTGTYLFQHVIKFRVYYLFLSMNISDMFYKTSLLVSAFAAKNSKYSVDI